MLLSVLSHDWLFVTPWTVVWQAPLSIGILQARILEWVAISFSRGSSWPRDWSCSPGTSCIGRWILYYWATWEVTREAPIYTVYSYIKKESHTHTHTADTHQQVANCTDMDLKAGGKVTCTLDTSCKVTDTVSVSCCVCGKSLQTVTSAMKLKDAPGRVSWFSACSVGSPRSRGKVREEEGAEGFTPKSVLLGHKPCVSHREIKRNIYVTITHFSSFLQNQSNCKTVS